MNITLRSIVKPIDPEIFGKNNFRNEIIWHYGQRTAIRETKFDSKHDNLLLYSKSDSMRIYKSTVKWSYEEFIQHRHDVMRDENGEEYILSDGGAGKERYRRYVKDVIATGKPLDTVWDLPLLNSSDKQRQGYPTQKPDYLLERIIEALSQPGDIVLDCFMGSGTTQAVAMKLGRRFIGADINLGAVQTTTKRLLKVAEELEQKQSQPTKVVQLPIPQATPTLRPISGGKDTQMPRRAAESEAIYSTAEESESDIEPTLEESEPAQPIAYYTGFEVYNVNHYDVFRNPLEAKDLLLEVLEVNRLEQGNLFDGEKDGRMVKMMPVNRIATRADLNELIAGFDYKTFERRQQDHPHAAVAKITLVCMGHEPDLAAQLKKEMKPFELDVEVVDILRDRQEIQFKRDSEARIVVKGKELAIETFYPMNLLGKLSLQQENVEDWRELVESVMIDWNYDGAIFQPLQVDIPDKNELVSGRYPIPDDAGTIRVKITDLLSESLEVEIQTE